MPVVRSLNILFKGDTSHFKRSSKSFRKQLDGIGSSVKMMNAIMVTTFAGSAVGAVGKLINRVDEARSSFRELQQQAQNLNLSRGEFKAVSGVFRRFSVDQETSVDLLQEMGLRASDAATGLAGVGEFFTMLNQDVETFVKLDTATQFRNIVEEIGKLEDRSTQIQMLDEIFGDAGKRLLPLIDIGVKGFDDMLGELNGITASLDEINTDKMEEFNRQSALLQTKVETVGMVLFTDVLGALTSVSTEANGLFSETGIKELRHDFQEMIVSVVVWKDNLVSGFDAIGDALSDIGFTLDNVKAIGGGVNSLFGISDEEEAAYEKLTREAVRIRLGFVDQVTKGDRKAAKEQGKVNAQELQERKKKWENFVKDRQKLLEGDAKKEKEKDGTMADKKSGSSDSMAMSFSRAIGLDAIIGAQTNPQLQEMSKQTQILASIDKKIGRGSVGVYGGATA